MRLITLTTDFGTSDWFVGAMKGVVLGISPSTAIIDITHGVPAGDIRAGAFALMAACRYFPKGAVHVAVVDPGVGSPRRAIAVQTADYFFVGPDNGVLSWALAREKIKSIRQLENQKYFLDPVSRTFHGRDIFAPVAAHLSRELPVERLGRELADFVRLPWPRPTQHGGDVIGEVVCIDHFGNAITNIESASAKGSVQIVLPSSRTLRGKSKAICPLAECYSAVPAGHAVAVAGSSGFLEIAVNGASASRRFGLKAGDRIIVKPARCRHGRRQTGH